MTEEKETSWYSHLNADEINGKHVRVRIDDGTVIESYLVYDDQGGCVRLGDSVLPLPWESKSHKVFPSPAVLTYEDDECLYPLQGVESIDLVWDERDWDRIDAKDLRDGDAVVANGRLYRVDVSWTHENPPQVVTDTPGRMRIDLRLVSCALRRKVKVPSKYGYYRDRDGFFWARTMRGDKKPWHPINQYFMNTPAMIDEAMAFRVPLTPVHFVDGRAPEPGDELASVMRVTSKGVTFTTEAA